MRTRLLRRFSPILCGAAVAAFGYAPAAGAQTIGTPFVPYYGKNHIHYNSFKWRIYTTDHFQIYFYPEEQSQLERIASYAESAYQHDSSVLKHDLAFKVPLLIFKTPSEFEEENVSGDTSEEVLGFSEPFRNRILLPIDGPPDELYHTICHELTHIFEFDIIPQGLISNSVPLWIMEGLAEYDTGYWNPLDLMALRDVAISDTVPRMSDYDAEPLSGRAPYYLGHAAFEFIEAKWGMDGLRQFLFSLRKSIIGGGASAYEEALKVKPAEFDDQFERYLKDRFKPFRDKEMPSDYGPNLAPNPEKTPYVSTISIEPSPSGDLIAAVVANIHDYELDIVLLSAKDGQVIRNLTKGFDKDKGWDYITTAGGFRGNLVPWLAWSPSGDRLAFFVRKEKQRTLIIENIVTGRIEDRVEIKDVDAAESPAFSPDGHKVAFAGTRNAIADIFLLNLDNRQITNLTNDAFFDYSPAFSPDGKTVCYTERISGSDELMLLDLATSKKTQVTFGTDDYAGARYFDDHTLIFTSTAVDPKVTMTPEVAKNDSIPNIWTLDLRTNELKQWTDAAIGNILPIVVRQAGITHIAFISTYKQDNTIHVLTRDTPLATASTSDYGAAGPTIDFQPPVSHTLVPKNIHDKGAFEKFTLDNRPSVNVGVTSNGNLYGATELTFDDVLGDKQMDLYIADVSTFRSYSFTYRNIGRRFQYQTQVFLQDEFFFAQNTTAALFYDPELAPFIDRSQAQEVISSKGGIAYGIYPLSRYSRLELFGGFVNESTTYTDPTVQAQAVAYQTAAYGTPLFNSGNLIPLGVAFVQETTVFREYGPVAGSTMRIAYDGAPKVSSAFLSRQTVDADLRHYIRLGANGLLALRARGFNSWGQAPEVMYFGGNSDLAGYDYLSFVGEKAFFGDAELRFPIIEAMKTPVGILGGVRGKFFFDIGAAGLAGQPFSPWTNKAESYSPLLGYQYDTLGNATAIYGSPVTVTGFRLRDARASYGVGLETFVIGFPVHIDWAWRTLFNKQWEDLLFASDGGSAWFRHPQTKFWIGFDF